MARGFYYTDSQARFDEFKLAADYFKHNPGEVKISRKKWQELYPNNPPQNSYLQRPDGQLLAIAHGEGAVLGKGASGRVKFAMDIHGGHYALKIESTNTDLQQNESKTLQNLGLMHGDKVTRHTKSSKSQTKVKFYSTLTYLGKDLADYNNQVHPSPKERRNDARKLAWEVHKLHAGFYSKDNTKLAHLDIKLENAVRTKNGRIRLIDYGFAESLHSPDPVKLRGTPDYLPVTPSEWATIKHPQVTLLKKDETVTAINERMQKLKREGCDAFALKRLIFYPFTDYQTLFPASDFKTLPPKLQSMLDTKNPANYTSKDTPLDITFALIEYAMIRLTKNAEKFPENLSTTVKEQICTCFGLLDELNECVEDLTVFSEQAMQAYQLKIMRTPTAEYPALINTFLATKNIAEKLKLSPEKILQYSDLIFNHKNLNIHCNELVSLENCSKLLDKISACGVKGVDDKGIRDYIAAIKLRINTVAPNQIGELENELTKALEGVNSPEMQSVKQEIERLRKKAAYWTWGRNATLNKITKIENVLQNVPVEARLHVFTYKNSDECHELRKALAHNRWRNKGKEIDSQTNNVTHKAANSFKHLKTQYGEITKELKKEKHEKTTANTPDDPEFIDISLG